MDANEQESIEIYISAILSTADLLYNWSCTPIAPTAAGTSHFRAGEQNPQKSAGRRYKTL